LSENPVIDVGDLRLRGEGRLQTLPTLNIDELERLAYEEALRQTNQRAKDAMALLGVKRATFYHRLHEYQLECED
jgi:DNA-binding NtrC family response regulator